MQSSLSPVDDFPFFEGSSMTSKQLLFGVDPAADWRVQVLLERPLQGG